MKGKITLIQILLICVFLICSAMLISERIEKNRDKKELDTVIKTVPTQNQDVAKDVSAADSDAEKLNKYKSLYELNNDTVGWIKIADTNIDYPVLQNTQSNAYYLHRDFEREYSSSGIPFMDYQCRGDATSDNTVIYAHNMRNGTMFHDLLKYKQREFYEQHKIIEFDTLEKTGKYEIFAVLHTNVGVKNEFKYYEFIDAETPSEFDDFVSECIKRSIYKTDIIPVYGDKLLTLSTCSYNSGNERFVVFARKITV